MNLLFLLSFFIFILQNINCEEIKSYNFIMLDKKYDKRYSDWGVHPVDIRSKYNKEKRAIDGARLAIKESEKFIRLSKTKFTLER